MARILFAALIVMHGLLHLLGFVKAWGLAPVRQLSGTTTFPLGETALKIAGSLWLAALVAFAATATAFLLRKDWWWMIGASAVILSQMLIVLYWSDAWAGTAANLIILFCVVVSWGSWKFDGSVQGEIEALLSSARRSTPHLLTADSLAELPPPVRRFLERSNALGSPPAVAVRLKQTGTMMSKPDGGWTPFSAEQYFSVEHPAFIWKARMAMAPLVDVVARDRYSEGRGNMLIKALSLVTIADARGPEMDQGTLLRYLAETAWFPSAALSPYIRWEPIDSTSAKATMTFGAVSASGTFTFDAEGDVTRFEAKRYGEFGGKYSLETWSIAMKGYRSFQGIRIPNVSEVTWKLAGGDWTWLKLEITELEFNVFEPWTR
jgi:hypothetical protein